MELVKKKEFKNGVVYALKTDNGYPIEVTDTFLPFYTKDAVGRKQNSLCDYYVSDRKDRWMIGVSCMSGCPVHCKFCATGKLKEWHNLTSKEIVEQILFVLERNSIKPSESKEFKINYTRMGEPFLNIDAVRDAINTIDFLLGKDTVVHHYISTIGIKGSDFSWIKDNITLQLSLHSLDEEKRNWLIPYKNKMTIQELGSISTQSKLKTTLNMTLVDENDFNIDVLKKYFPLDKFFIKLSPINVNEISEKQNVGSGVIKQLNLI